MQINTLQPFAGNFSAICICIHTNNLVETIPICIHEYKCKYYLFMYTCTCMSNIHQYNKRRHLATSLDLVNLCWCADVRHFPSPHSAVQCGHTKAQTRYVPGFEERRVVPSIPQRKHLPSPPPNIPVSTTSPSASSQRSSSYTPYY